MKTMGYCVALATAAFLCLNGGEEAGIVEWGLSLLGIITALLLLVRGEVEEKECL